MEKINALIEKLQELKNSNAGLQTISYYVQLLQAEVLHTRNAQLQQKNTQTNIAVILPSDRMASHNTLPPAEIPAPVAQATAPVPPVAENVPAGPAPAAPENMPTPAIPAPAASADNIPAAPAPPVPPAAPQQPKEEAKPVILHIPKLVAAYTPPVIKHPPPPAPETPVHTPAPAPAAAAPIPASPPAEPVPAATHTPPATAMPAANHTAPTAPPAEHAPAATYTPPAAAMPAANHTVPTASPAAVPAPAAAAQPAPQVPKPTPATLFDTTAAPAHHNGHRQEQPAENRNIRKELNELVGQTQSGTSLNERLRTANVEVAEKLREMGVKDLRDAIGINDKFQFIQELFRGDRDMYDRSVKTINECTSLQEAEYWIQRELKIYQGWQDEDSLVKHFYSLVKKRFS